jgi:hypothetical protein
MTVHESTHNRRNHDQFNCDRLCFRDREEDKFVRAKRKATTTVIAAIGGRVVEPGEQIDASLLDADGFRRHLTPEEMADVNRRALGTSATP